MAISFNTDDIKWMDNETAKLYDAISTGSASVEETENELTGILTDKNSVLACKFCDSLCNISLQSRCCYPFLELFASLLGHKNSLVRNRAISLIAVNMRWGNDEKTDEILNRMLLHIADAKPITARQCIKALSDIAIHCPQYRDRIIVALRTADFSQYADSMRPLLEADRKSALDIMEKQA